MGVRGELGVGYCLHHRAVEVEAGNAVAVTSHAGALPLTQSSTEAVYRVQGTTRLAEILQEMGFELRTPKAVNGQVRLDLTGELAAARGLLALFLERHAEREDALLLWAQAYEAGDLGSPPPRIFNITEGHKAVLAIAQLAKTMHDMQQAIPRGAFMRILTRMGEAVEEHVADPIAKRRIRDDFIAASAEYIV